MDRDIGTLDVAEAVDRIGFGRFQRRLILICGLAWAADAAEILLIGFALPSVSEEFGLTSAEAGLIATATFLGMMTGAWLWGSVADHVGRKTALQVTIVISSVFGGLAALAPDGWWLAGLRAVTGFGLGGTLPLNFALVAELLPSRNRGRNLVLLEAFWALGTVAAAGLAWLLVPPFGWRPLLAVTAVTIIVVYWIRRDVPESPRYLATAGRADEAAAVLRAIARRNGADLPDRPVGAPPSSPPGVGVLLRPAYRRATAMLWTAWGCIALGYYGLFTWLPSVFVERGYAFLATYRFTFVLALAQIPGYLAAAFLVEVWGRRRTLTTFLSASAAFTYLFAVAGTTTGIVASAALMSFFALGAWGALYAYTPEVYPTAIRATGVGWASGMTRIAGAAAPIVGGVLLPVSVVAALTVYAVAFAGGALAVGLLGTETAGRRLADTVRSR